MKKFSKRARWCCCSGCAVLILIPLTFVTLLLMPPPRPRPLSAPERAAAAKRAEAVKREVKAIAKDAKEGRRRDFRLEIGEAEVNELIQNDTDVQQILVRLQLEDPYVVMDTGSIRLTATRNVSGVNAVSTVEVSPSVDSDGHIRVSVEGAQIGRLQLPDAMTRRYANRVARDLALKANEGKVKVRTVRVEPGQIVIEGSTK